VRLYVPVATLVDNVIVNVDAAVGFGFTGVASEQVAPVGQPVTARSMLPLKPFSAVTVEMAVPVPTCTSDIVDGFADTRKSGLVDTLA